MASYRASDVLLIFISIWTTTTANIFNCTNESCVIENVDLNEDYRIALSYPNTNTTTYQLMVVNVRGQIFDLTTLPNVSNIRDFLLEHSRLLSLIVKLTPDRSAVCITETPLQTIIFHESRSIVYVRIEKTLLEVIPSTIYSLELLETLFLTHSHLVTIDFDLFSKLSNLLYVNFSYNKLHTLHSTPGNCFCCGLLSLELQNNLLEEFNFDMLAHMGSLMVMDLRSNRLRTFQIRDDIELPHFCAGTFTEGPSTSKQKQKTMSSSRFVCLERISLDGNQLRKVNFSMLANMPNLRGLTLASNLLTEVIVVDGQLPRQLQFVDLRYNRLANADLKSVLGIKSVDIGGNL